MRRSFEEELVLAADKANHVCRCWRCTWHPKRCGNIWKQHIMSWQPFAVWSNNAQASAHKEHVRGQHVPRLLCNTFLSLLGLQHAGSRHWLVMKTTEVNRSGPLMYCWHAVGKPVARWCLVVCASALAECLIVLQRIQVWSKHCAIFLFEYP